MTTATTISSEAADKMAMIGARLGNYTRAGRIEIVGEKIGLSPSQARRIAQGRRKSVPGWVMDRLRALYNETCESLEEGNRKLIEENDAAVEKRRQQDSCVDGEEDERKGRRAHAEERDEQAND